jgi:two-component system, NarL family, response regulator DevR
MLLRESAPLRLLLVDDHEKVRKGLRTLFSSAKTIHVVGEAGTAADAITAAARLRPDVVLMDLRLPDGSSVDACQAIRAACAATKVLFLTSYFKDDAVLATIAAGASGYLLKEIHGEVLIRSIESVAASQSTLGPAVALPHFISGKLVGYW